MHHPLPYPTNTLNYSELLHELPWFIWFDSCPQGPRAGRYDIITACPYQTLTTVGDTTTINHSDGMTVTSKDNPFDLLKTALAPHEQQTQLDIPFAGGAAGYFAYDLGRRLEPLPCLAKNDIQLPEMAIGLYDWAIVIDHHKHTAALVSHLTQTKTHDLIKEILLKLKQPPARPTHFFLKQPFQSNTSKKEYLAAIKQIKQYLYDGECYQINYTHRFSAACEGDSWSAYQRLRQVNPAPFSSYFNTPTGNILSHSPEQFIQVRAGIATTQPIKGTRPRHTDPHEDKHQSQMLLNSTKDRAENTMIVDLLRNDFGKVCQPGSIHVEALCELQSFSNVHHLVSNIQGKLVPHSHSLDLLRHCFPGGSITGAPKIRAMQLIESLESHRRSVYCGSIGYIGFDQQLDSNIVIRSFIHHNNKIHCYSGGGIVADSDAESEYLESLSKVKNMLDSLPVETKS